MYQLQGRQFRDFFNLVRDTDALLPAKSGNETNQSSDFSQPMVFPNQKSQRILQGAKAMEDIRQASRQPDFRGDLTAYFLNINSLPSIRVSLDKLAQIMQMAFDPYLVRPPPMTGSSRSRR